MSAATRPPRHPAAAAEARDGGRRREAVAGRGGTDLLSSSGGGGAALRVVGGGGPPRWRSGGGGGGARGASHPRTRGGGRRRSVGLSPFFRGVFFSFFFPFYSSSGLGLGRRIVSYRRACARLLLVWASRRVALFFSFFFFLVALAPSVRACVRKYGPPSTQAKRRRRCGFSYSSCERICPLLTRRFLLWCNTLLRR